MTHYPQPFGLCDVCNGQVTDREFKALDEVWHFPSYLYCKECFIRYRPDKDPANDCIKKYNKGDNLKDDGLCGGITVF